MPISPVPIYQGPTLSPENTKRKRLQQHLIAQICGGTDLSQANLANAILTNAYLRETNLSAAKLVGASLRDANLNGAIINDADFTGADLTGARVTESQLATAITCDTTGPTGELLYAGC